jgi:phage/plasmid-like protein (TIGR03299 family)
MAHQIHQHDNIMVTGKPAWHRLGIVVEDAPTPEAALQLSGLDWTVDPSPLYAMHQHSPSSEVTRIVCEDQVANVRSDTREVLGIVGTGYQAVQNSELAELCWAAADEGAIPRIESAGSLKNGRITFMCARMEDMLIGGKDLLVPYMSLINGNDGTRSLSQAGHTIRTECYNTADYAMFEARQKGLLNTMRHTKNIKDNIQTVRQMFEQTKVQMGEFKQTADRLYSRKLNGKDVESFFIDVYTKHIDRIPSNVESKEDERKRNKALSTVSKWLRNFESKTCNNDGCGGSAWAALNAITEWSDHQRTVRTTRSSANKEQARQFANLFGSSKNFKKQVATSALQLV